ncbi:MULTISPECIES: D-alanine--D-alanine ligase family protein [Bifidobacterium]|jgi:D-alanine--(R)-lactate ligase|uniref:D-alanine--D-alanine ligase n=1 Tax=Bifidobacterium tibiigranuli TaxID=2172043 RepID=A0A5N6S0G4_9BIFI|nr:D-alanine--D-alanine ligase family protein [Bifidobacterium tibiigranuli]KAE8127170.1 D-alanine--D-alanine ligase [Bifidobacterium tibiigranuli]KAE8127607.1 D-alanine--(R)-lactate ligase [Bifidobacterium tibiigranuli]MCH3974246.1 D-alanine--D-alanine ligase [Bifidobacterium tibiigranuli]MCH4188809.1 D-alanine--D-alanine ligase [Bifidobacterium tibiigranuli]MCH4203286.1 D-alanine--D-alanine ligase [Bifidobacterium tibiigranuli]
MSATKVGILFGGIGEEHDVSVKSACEVAKSLDPQRYEPYWIGISREGAWKLCKGPDTDWEHDFVPASLSPDRDVHGLVAWHGNEASVIRLDVVLPALHGTMGEDGTIQGLLELSGIPYVGCDVESSVICMDKSLAYLVATDAGIATPGFHIVRDGDSPDPQALDYPVFVKPARSGSSFGVSKVSGPDELQDALALARQYDSKVLIEQAIIGKEIGCSVLENESGLTLGEVDHVALSTGFLRIHLENSPETGSQNSQFISPADIPQYQQQIIKDAAVKVYRALGCTGIARVDMFLTEDDKAVLNEVNTLPGLTSYSRYPRMMKAAGLTFADVVDQLIAHALHVDRR